ncbi:hypothetical protein LEMLEM_LOCUS17763, partial [Lemmus lemmus]
VPVLLQVPGKALLLYQNQVWKTKQNKTKQNKTKQNNLSLQRLLLTPDTFKHILQVTPAVWAKNNSQSALQIMPSTCTSSWDFTIGTNSLGSRTLPTKIWLFWINHLPSHLPQKSAALGSPK